MTTPFKHWHKGLEKIKGHASLKYHQDAMFTSEGFLTRMKNPKLGIDMQLDALALEQTEKNHIILSGIVEIILLCGQQGLALRGTNDDGVLCEDNPSNFNALLKFRISSGDQHLKQHLETCGKHATYISKTTQNNLINIIGSQITSHILAEVKAAKFYSILADEVTDKANWEQLSIVLRFVDSTSCIKEEFMTFVPCVDITGRTIANNILQKLEEWGLDVQDLRGQGYDGAANMSGKFQGVQARIKELNDKALYVHCASHCLNLCVLKACSVAQVNGMFGVIKEISLFFSSSPKRQRKLENVIAETFAESKKQKLVDLCRTRWVERHVALDTFAELYQVVCGCFGQMCDMGCDSWDSDTLTKATGLLHSMKNGTFVVAFVTARKGLEYIKPLTLKLQTKSSDISLAHKHVGDVTACIEGLRESADVTFAQWFTEAQAMAEAADFQIDIPRKCQRQTLRDNHPGENTEEYFRRSVGVPFLDHLLSQLKSRFQNAQLAADGLTLVPATLVQQTAPGFNVMPDGVQGLADLWQNDLPDRDGLEAEYNRRVCKWLQADLDKPATASAALKACDRALFPNIFTILQLLCTLPITTSECERTISRLKTIKTYLRSSISQERLNGLALMRIHHNKAVDVTAVVDAFARKFRTRMKLKTQDLLCQ